MTTWHALYYPLRSGCERTVGDLFAASGRPQFDVADQSGQTVGRLLGTMAFVGAEKAIRVMEVEGALPLVAAHMSRQPEVREFEHRLEEHLAVPRDMTSPDGAKAFFREAAMNSVAVAAGEPDDPGEWTGLFYPIRSGHEPAVRELGTPGGDHPDLTMRDDSGDEVGRVSGMMFFVGREKALRLVKVDGAAAGLGGHMSRQPAARDFQRQMDDHLTGTRDVDSPVSAGEYFARARMECVLSRRHDKDV